MIERPILFSAPMVRALLDGNKTQTRRIITPKHKTKAGHIPGDTHMWSWDIFNTDPDDNAVVCRCPYGQAGDRLWVRESFWGCDLPAYGDQPCVVYDDEWNGHYYAPKVARPWARKFGRIPSIHMPRDCSRITLEIIDVRVDRLNEISEEDALAEGVTYNDLPNNGLDPMRARTWYRGLWDKINGAGSYSKNPWVWVIEFKRIES